MKTLYIVRHAKSSWDFPDLPDIDRPVIEKGIYNTKKIAAELKSKNVVVDHIISSHAKRARETAKIIATGINFPIEKIEVSKNIYQKSDDDILDVISGADDNFISLMVIGHNPMLTQCANRFLDKQIELLPTSGVIAIDFETNSWLEISKAKHKTNFMLFPKQIND
ncbi:MAG: histidine phosphatase family protein [Bacteroidales bacterium]|jgi:phosphohistidine phosphatase